MGELQGLKHTLKSQAGHRLNTLAEVVDKMESVVSEGVEHDEYICPECGDIFRLVGYKLVTLMEPRAWRLMQLRK